MDQFDQPRQVGPARKRVRLYVERFIALAREGSEGDDDEQAPRVDVVDHITLDVRDLRALTEGPTGQEAEPAKLREMAKVIDVIAHYHQIDLLGDGRQEAHDRARQEDPDHDQVSCVCCCFDCDE